MTNTKSKNSFNNPFSICVHLCSSVVPFLKSTFRIGSKYQGLNMQTKSWSTYQFEFRPYRRSFKRTLSTSHGNWDVREGIILRLQDETGRVGWGEIAPIPWFGSESLEQALAFCQQLPPKITATDILSIPDQLPACQFGFESACVWGEEEWGESSPSKIQNLKSIIPYSNLLPTGEVALQSWQTPWHQGNRTFKWKIGVAAITQELKLFNQLIQGLPLSAKLRLYANGGLTE